MLGVVQIVDQRSRLVVWHGAGGVPPGGAKPHVVERLEPQATTVRAERDEEIVAQGEAAEHCYLVVSGCVRTVNLMEDGRRQIGEFLFFGDLFGWETRDEHEFAAEAVTQVTLRRYTRRSLEAIADRDRDFARRMRDLTAGQLRAGREGMVLLGRKTASERIASFLLEVARRMNPDDRTLIELPMGRADMADYLGLTIETVCRGLTQLRRHGTIAVERARIMIYDRSAPGIAGCSVAH